MKKIFKYFIIILCMILIPRNVYAFSASASCSGSKTVAIGETFTVTISTSSDETDWMAIGPVNTDTSKLSLVSDS